jgi:hypothetical protein
MIASLYQSGSLALPLRFMVGVGRQVPQNRLPLACQQGYHVPGGSEASGQDSYRLVGKFGGPWAGRAAASGWRAAVRVSECVSVFVWGTREAESVGPVTRMPRTAGRTRKPLTLAAGRTRSRYRSR